MQKKYRRKIARYIWQRRRNETWNAIVRFLAAVVVFVTTYSLILPAITMEQSHLCGLEAHVHSDSCFIRQEKREFTCIPGDNVLHRHEGLCFDEQGQLLCPWTEKTEHLHTDSCNTEGILSCGLTEICAHTHSESCLDETGAQICTLPEMTVHTHTEACVTAVQEALPICTLTEHTHDAACDSDPAADVETEADWRQTLAPVVYTGNWNEDLVAVAQSQIGYRESTRNYIVEAENTLKGYSRYGAWYGIPYGKWDAMFVSFCLHHAGIPQKAMPRYSSSRQWFAELAELGWIDTLPAQTPTAGDIAFFGDPDGTVRFSAIMTEVVLEGETTCYRYIAGDCADAVTSSFVPAQDSGLLGFVSMERVYQRYQELLALSEQTEPAETGEATVPAQTEETAVPDETEETTVSTETTETTESTETTETTETTESAETTETTESTETTETTESTETTEATESTETTGTTESAETTEPTCTGETTLPTEPEEPTLPPVRLTQTVETENYIVTVSYSSALMLPEGAELRVMEYSRDSEIFRQRCIQAGYELDWLLNIGFFIGEEELDLRGSFDVVVTGKDDRTLGTDVTHFAGSGTERINGETAPEEGQSAVAFTAGSFSDFGGGVAPAAETDNPANVTLHFTSWSSYNYVNFPQGNNYQCSVGDTVTIVLTDNGANYQQPEITVTGGELISCTYTCGTPGCSHGWCGTAPTHTIVVRVTSPEVYIRGSVWGAGWDSGGNSVSISSVAPPVEPEEPEETTEATTQPTQPGNPQYPNHPPAVSTGNVDVSRLRFYNICENGNNGVSALEGCVFEITGDNGYSCTIVSGNKPEVDIPGYVPDGVYTITEVSAADGYMRDIDYRRTFTVKGEKLVSGNTIGTFINHNLQQLTSDKTAEVEDYNNRIYQILMSAESHIRTYQMDPVDVLFVVDQSNSMLFPAGLNSTGKSVKLSLNNGSQNVSNMENLKLDKNQVYYIISDPQGTSTVWAVWYNGQGWVYQDASYYAKAYARNHEGYQDPKEFIIYPTYRSYADQSKNEDKENGRTDVRSNGGGLGFTLGGGLGTYIDSFSGDSETFEIYTASSGYNRLHYLEEALTSMIYELADVNDKNRVTLTEFTKVVDSANDCMGPLELSPDNVEKLVSKVRGINTSGGTRQDIALKHVYEEHLNDASEGFKGDPQYTYTILITDGAPVKSTDDVPNKVGSPTDAASTTANSIYAQIKGYAALVRSKSTLMTVGLGMDKVEGGKKVLQEIATNQNFNCALDDAAELVHQIQKLLFDAFRPKDLIQVRGNVKDQISDSFYPIAWVDPGTNTDRQFLASSGGKEWILLQEGDWITLEGKFALAGTDEAAGQLIREEDGTYAIMWNGALLSNPFDGVDSDGVGWVQAGLGSSTGRTVLATYDNKDWIQLKNNDWISKQGEYYSGTPSYLQRRNYGQVFQQSDGTFTVSWGSSANKGNERIEFKFADYGWSGTVYVKAKEDFIGGNVINTNKDAIVSMTATAGDQVTAVKYMPTPTVNVRLLDLNEMRSEVTVYLGDQVNGPGDSPLDSMEYFFDNTVFTKLISDGGDVLNKVRAEDADGLEAAVFHIRYALGRDLTVDEWNLLAAGETDPDETNPEGTTEPSRPGFPPPENPGKEPTLPQTGQLNWPVPVMAVAGTSLLLLGCWLCFGKRKPHES